MSARVLSVVTLLGSTAAMAAAGSVVDVPLSGGVVGAWTGTTLGIAKSFLPLLFVVAFIVEAFGKAPGAPRDFGAVVWRFVAVSVLLLFYGRIFGELGELVGGVARSVAPADTWTKLQAACTAFLESKSAYQFQQLSAEASSGNFGGVAAEYVTGKVDALGGMLIDAVVSLIVLLGQAAFRIVGTFGEVLKLLLYVLGPLAIAASVPRGSNAGAQWLRVFVSVLLWPLISALLVGLMTAYALQALTPQSSYDSAYKAIALSGLLMVAAFAVPTIASALTGAGMSAVSAGWSSMNAWTGAVASGAAVAGAVGARGLGAAGVMPPAAGPAARGGTQGGIQPASVMGGGGGGGGGAGGSAGETPEWVRRGGGGIVPAVASVAPAADAAAARELAQGIGGAELKPPVAEAPKPPPFANDAGWSAGGIAPAKEDDNVPTVRPIGVPGPAAPPPRRAQAPAVAPAVAGAGPSGSPQKEALPGASNEAFRNWRKANPTADYQQPEHRAAIMREDERLRRGALQPAAERPTLQVPPFPKKR